MGSGALAQAQSWGMEETFWEPSAGVTVVHLERQKQSCGEVFFLSRKILIEL